MGWLAEARIDLVEQLADLRAKQEHGDDGQDRDPGEDQAVLGHALALFTLLREHAVHRVVGSLRESLDHDLIPPRISMNIIKTDRYRRTKMTASYDSTVMGPPPAR